MKKTLLAAASALALTLLARPVQAQSAESLAEIYQKEAKTQLADQKRFAGGPSSGGYMPSPRSAWRPAGGDPIGGYDAAGRSVPGYFTTRDSTTNFTTRYYAPNTSRRRVSRGARTPRPITPFVPATARP